MNEVRLGYMILPEKAHLYFSFVEMTTTMAMIMGARFWQYLAQNERTEWFARKEGGDDQLAFMTHVSIPVSHTNTTRGGACIHALWWYPFPLKVYRIATPFSRTVALTINELEDMNQLVPPVLTGARRRDDIATRERFILNV